MTENISRPVRRIDAVEKLAGQARYVSDYTFEGLLHARLLRSDRPRARIVDIAVPELPEGYFYIDDRDIPKGGKNRIHMIKEDWPVFGGRGPFCGSDYRDGGGSRQGEGP